MACLARVLWASKILGLDMRLTRIGGGCQEVTSAPLEESSMDVVGHRCLPLVNFYSPQLKLHSGMGSDMPYQGHSDGGQRQKDCTGDKPVTISS